MDLYCPICAEPFDNDEFHDVAEEIGSTYSAVITEFCRVGCKALEPARGPQPHCRPTPKAQAIAAIYDMMGDDTDAAAAVFDEASVFGLL